MQSHAEFGMVAPTLFFVVPSAIPAYAKLFLALAHAGSLWRCTIDATAPDPALERLRNKLARAHKLFADLDGTHHVRTVERAGLKFDEIYEPYVLGPPLAPEELARVEQKHMFGFPVAYRRFVTTLGDGGGGTFGLPALFHFAESYERTLQAMEQQDQRLTRPFSPTPVGEYEENGGYWILAAGYMSDTWLILAGPHRGEIWCHEWGNETLFHIADDVINWYEGCLARAEESMHQRSQELSAVPDPRETALDPNDVASLLQKARLMLRDDDQALRNALHEAFDSDAVSLEAQASLCDFFWTAHASEDLIAFGEKSLAKLRLLSTPEASELLDKVLPLVGIGYMWCKRPEGIDRLQEVIDRGSDPFQYTNLAQCLLDQARTNDAMEAIQHAPETFDALYLRGQIQEAMGEREAARASYHESIDLNDRYAESSLALGDLYRAEGTFDEAERCYTIAVNRGMTLRHVGYLKLAALHLQQEAPAQALDLLEKARAMGAKIAPLQADDAFASLREEPRFQALIAG